jgi:WD40 repeat protein
VNTSKPEFHLQRITSDGAAGPVEVYPVHALPTSAQMGRRGFLGAGVAVSGVLGLIGCGSQAQPRADSQPTSQPGPIPSPDPAAQDVPKKEPPKKEEKTGTPSSVVYAHKKGVKFLAVTDDGKKLVSVSEYTDGELKVWSLPDLKLLHSFPEKEFVQGLTLGPAGGHFVVVHIGDLAVWSAAKGAVVATIKSPEWPHNAFNAAHLIDGGRKLISSSTNCLHVWSFPEGKLIRKVETKYSENKAFAVTANEKLAVIRDGSRLQVVDLAGGESRKDVSSDRHDFWHRMVLTPDGQFVATSNAASVEVRSVPDLAVRRVLDHSIPKPGEFDYVTSLASSSDSRTLVTGGSKHAIKVWSLADGRLTATLSSHAASVNALAVTPDGKWLASADDEGVIILWDLRKGAKSAYAFDPKASKTDAYVYSVYDSVTKQTVTYTLPCGSPIPPGATCVCNCVPGTYRPYTGGSSGGFGGSYCTCNKICTCIPVCQAHRLLHPDPVVRMMAEQLLLLMGDREFGYMHWAAAIAEPPVRTRILDLITAIQSGAAADVSQWPGLDRLTGYMGHPDEIVAIMAAQMSSEIVAQSRGQASAHLRERIDGLVRQARERPWFVRYGVAEPSRLHQQVAPWRGN